MRTKIEAVIWDVDGTLIDSEPLHYKALLAVSAQYGCWIDDNTNESLLGKSLDEVYIHMKKVCKLEVDKIYWKQQIMDYYLAHVNNSMIRPGVKAAVCELNARKIPQACVSTAERRILEANLSALGLNQYIAFSIGYEDVEETKPSPTPYLKACQRLGFKPEVCIAVEDTEIGIHSARQAGLVTYAWPAQISQDQNFNNAHYTITGLNDLPWHNILGSNVYI